MLQLFCCVHVLASSKTAPHAPGSHTRCMVQDLPGDAISIEMYNAELAGWHSATIERIHKADVQADKLKIEACVCFTGARFTTDLTELAWRPRQLLPPAPRLTPTKAAEPAESLPAPTPAPVPFAQAARAEMPDTKAAAAQTAAPASAHPIQPQQATATPPATTAPPQATATSTTCLCCLNAPATNKGAYRGLCQRCRLAHRRAKSYVTCRAGTRYDADMVSQRIRQQDRDDPSFWQSEPWLCRNVTVRPLSCRMA